MSSLVWNVALRFMGHQSTKMGTIFFTERTVTNYQTTLRNIREEQKLHLPLTLKSCMVPGC